MCAVFVSLFAKYIMVFVHLHIAFTQSDLHFSDRILVRMCVIGGACGIITERVQDRETQVYICVLMHVDTHMDSGAIITSASLQLGWMACACVTGR